MEVLTFELSHIPRDVDEVAFKRALFGQHHVVRMETHKDNITGISNGQGRVQIRCSDLESEKAEILAKLNLNGIEAKIRSHRKEPMSRSQLR